jgi:hypothetical protein
MSHNAPGRRPALRFMESCPVVMLALSGAVFFWLCGCSESNVPGPAVLDARAENLKATQVSAHLFVPITRGTNLLWCGTFQLAWNEGMDFLGEKIRFQEDVPLAQFLNRTNFTKADVDAPSCVAAAGPWTSATVERIRSEARRKFGGDFKLELPTNPPSAPPGLFFYACLFKNLEFEKAFQPSEHPLQFGANQVQAFGIEDWDGQAYKLLKQVRILNYRDTNDFIVEFKTKSKGDTLILAKVPAQDTLAETVKDVCSRIEKPLSEQPDDIRIFVPKIDFNLLRTYDELLGKHLALTNRREYSDWFIADARQLVRFRLNERGAMLKSEAAMAVAPAAPANLILDQPFLVLLQRTDARVPYFALWIDNAELLVPWR